MTGHSYLANDPGKGRSLVLSYNHWRDQKGSFGSVWQHLAKTQDILKYTEEEKKTLVNHIYIIMTILSGDDP